MASSENRGRIPRCLTFLFSLWDIFLGNLAGCSPGENLFLENLADGIRVSRLQLFSNIFNMELITVLPVRLKWKTSTETIGIFILSTGEIAVRIPIFLKQF